MRVLDFVLRLAFFLVVPFLATFVSAFFPMTAVLVNIALTLVVFATAEVLRERAGRSWILGRLLKRQLAFEAHYRENPPLPFLFYVFYPLLLPYVLSRPVTRRELMLYRGITGGGLVVLLIGAGINFYKNWLPELPFSVFIVDWIKLFAIQTLCILLFLLPVATTVVTLHRQRRRFELWALFGAAAVSVTLAVVRLELKRGHIVSWVTTQRVSLRTQAAPEVAHRAQLQALRTVWSNPQQLKESTDKDGWVEGDALDRAEEVLEAFYKPDEAYAFSLHAQPANAPELLILQCHLGKGVPPIWRAVRKNGEEVLSPTDIPAGVLGLPRRTTRKAPVTPRAPAPRAPAPSATAPRAPASSMPGPSAPKKK